MLVRQSPVAKCVYCYKCNDDNCVVPWVVADISGLPCTPWSAQGVTKGLEDSCVEVHLKWILGLTLSIFCLQPKCSAGIAV